ncbi:16S rRNA (guanine(527)-N(7))-methyltransferase RsmG [Thiothrix subterranea]|uniref:Ribosomal RNA small subunit methyltransferase G n=1 Tax=Thiothrix subterranea TaxID=2735563 RepID=A0AA51R4T6_9GAMM|nr:16S rRNA (guanine(527)-N(7))-methyltransferase RsmG [Thiothrix subterranea]MDQ5768418.1 16S rRNA (guanine(527)-N(7))-methyltransferase RsmG [Thiothrix subterranea]WML87005.1 16S rRNA (guanine(527)-N(7))-methyltransferase RsmG [Thiothrix subterranea]
MDVDAHDKALLNRYLQLLQRWNKVFNLTAVRDAADMQSLHIADSISVAPFLRGKSCLDVGSGAGLPGIPLAILQPDRQFTLLDTNGKKTRFIQQAVLELGLPNVKVVQTRVESWQPAAPFEAIISRAFASLHDFVTFTGKHVAENGILYAMKGRYPDSELAELPAGWRVTAQHPLHVPGLDAERHLLEIQRD